MHLCSSAVGSPPSECRNRDAAALASCSKGAALRRAPLPGRDPLAMYSESSGQCAESALVQRLAPVRCRVWLACRTGTRCDTMTGGRRLRRTAAAIALMVAAAAGCGGGASAEETRAELRRWASAVDE